MPVIVIELPIDPVVADTLLITGAGFAAELTETLSKVVVCKVPDVPLSKPTPKYTFVAILIVTLDPICVQFVPSGDS